MHVIWVNTAGRRSEAILLATGHNRLRVVVRGSKDAMELQFHGNRWISEDGEAVEFDCVVCAAPMALPMPTRSFAAGQPF